MPKKNGPPCTKSIWLAIPPALDAFLLMHSMRRDISKQDLIRCILTCWTRRRTPMDDPVFGIESIGYHLPPPVDEEQYYPDYLKSLGFLPEEEVEKPSVPDLSAVGAKWPSQR